MDAGIPSDRSRTAKIALAALAGALGTALVAGGLWLAFRPSPAPTTQTAIEPAEETSEETSASAPGSSDSSATTGAPEPGNPGIEQPGTGGAGGKARAVRAPKVAYRKGERIWVAGEDGKGAVAVCYGYRNYALSPDGRTLAVVPDSREPGEPSSSTNAVRLLDVSRTAIDAAAATVSWAGTSRWLAFVGGTSGSYGAYRVDTGGGLRKLAEQASSPKASVNGSRVAYLVSDPEGGSPRLLVASATGASPRALKVSAGATSWAWGTGDVLYFLKPGASQGAWELWSSRPPYSTASRVGSVRLPAPAFALADLSVSPDGKRVLAAAMGDDDYSRLWVFDAGDRRFHTISTRRDAYPYGWSADGRNVLYFEGNAYQGEPSSLMSCRPDGAGRRVVVEGAIR